MYLFYELSIVLGRLMLRRRDRSPQPEGAAT
jgi:hypothetical protein